MGTYLYDFNGTDTADGNMPTPLEHPVLEQVSGTWRRLNNRAYTSTSHYSDPILAITDGVGDGDVTVNISPSGGDCAYVRVADASNWTRLRFRRWQTSYTTTYYVTEYEWRAHWNHSGSYHHDYTGVDGYPTPGGVFEWKWHTSSTSAPYFPYSNSTYHSHVDGWNHTHDYYMENEPFFTGSTRQSPRYGTSYTTHYGLYLERCVNGSITTLDSIELGSPPTMLRLRAQGSTIEAFYNGNTSPVFTATDSNPSPYPRHGIGRGDSEQSGQALDNFSFDSLNTPANPPTGLSPADGAKVSNAVDLVLSWVFSDPDPSDTQGAYDLEWRRIGDESFTRVASGVQTATPEHVIPAADLEPATEYEWRVRTYDQTLSTPGPWSAVTGFTTLAYGSVLVDGQVKQVSNMTVLVGGAQKPVTAVSVIVGGVKKPVG